MIAAASFLSPQRAKEKLETGVDLPVCFHEYMCDQDVGVSPLLISRPSMLEASERGEQRIFHTFCVTYERMKNLEVFVLCSKPA